MSRVGFLIRHGSTEHNEEGLTRGLSNVALSPDGIQQAHDIAAHMAPQKITSLKSSDLERGQHTAAIIAHATGAMHKPTPNLRPIGLGDYTGVPTDSVKDKITHLVTEKPDEQFPNGQSYKEWLDQVWPEVRQFLMEIRQGGRPARVIHGTMANLFHALIHGEGKRLAKEILKNPPKQKPGEIYVVRHDGKNYTYEGPLNHVEPKTSGAGS